MKKRRFLGIGIALLLIIVVLLVLIGRTFVKHSSPQNVDSSEYNQPMDSGYVSVAGDADSLTSDSYTEDTELNEHEVMKAVLLGNAPFCYINGSEIDTITIFDVPSLFDPNDEYMKIWEYVVVDLDADGQDEVVLFVAGAAGDTGGKLILLREGEEVYGYKVDNRKLVDLKTDGTFYYSEGLGGTEDGIAVITNLSGSNMELDRITYAKGKNGEFDTFTVDREPATEEEYLDRVSQQDQKTNAKWYEFSEENISSSFRK